MKVVVAGEYSPTCTEKIRACFPENWDVVTVSPDDAVDVLPDADALIPEHLRVDAALLDHAARLRIVQTGAGYDNVDVIECTRRGIVVCNAAGINANAVAEQVMAFMLCYYRNIALLDNYMKSGGIGVPAYRGGELRGKTVGIVGLGAVGSTVVRLCLAFGMRVIAYSRSDRELDGVELVSLDTLLRQSNVVTLHVSLNDATRGMINSAVFSIMKSDALLINTSRGGIVDETALIDALTTGQIGGACLDVFAAEPLPIDSPLRSLPNVLLTPHTAGFPDGAKFHERRYRFFAENIERVMRGEEPENRVDIM